ncbi:MAG: NAD-dependent dehydratase [Verrucomicrobia bacterium Tous-C9LFEB]|nr:MAG: NAD-dependent dehydratase [Verrucomicrobia bacterium Tous-C9LFEB]
MNWKNKKVLVTGAGGFIGSHLAERLVKEGANVKAVVHYNALGTAGWLQESTLRRDMEIVYGDVRDSDWINEVTAGSETIFHLAALIAIPYSYHAPRSYVQTNIEGTLNLLQAARNSNVECFVQTSTSEVYGSAQTPLISEQHPLHPQSPYAASKVGSDKLAESYHLSFKLPVVIARPFNTFGPRQSARAIIPTIITQALAKNVVKLGNVHPTRDLNFVSNTVEGFLAAASTPKAIGQTFNFGSGREITIGDLAELILKLIGKDVRLETESERQRPAGSEVTRLQADSTLANQVLNWTAKKTLEEGLVETIEWLRQHLGRYQTESYVV